MADTVTCPACGQQHAVGTTWCPVMFVDVSELRDEPAPPAPDPAPEPAAPPTRAPVADAGLVECPVCGARGQAGQPCPQCMEVIPRPVAPARASQAVVVLPSLRGVAIPRGREIVVGRQSDIPEIRAGLAGFDGVSRRHCYVTVDATREVVTIRDPDSMNRTWVGDDEREIGANERRVADLPARLRLGRTAYLTITTEGVR